MLSHGTNKVDSLQVTTIFVECFGDTTDSLSHRIIHKHIRCAANPSQTPPSRTATADRQPRNIKAFLRRIRTLSEAATATSATFKLLAQRKTDVSSPRTRRPSQCAADTLRRKRICDTPYQPRRKSSSSRGLFMRICFLFITVILINFIH